MRNSEKQMRKGLGKSPRNSMHFQASNQEYPSFSIASSLTVGTRAMILQLSGSSWAPRLFLLHNPVALLPLPQLVKILNPLVPLFLGLGRRLKNELLEIKRKGAKRGSQHYSDRTCARCQEGLGRLISKSNTCVGCNHLVCRECRVLENNGSWRCKVCAKEM